MAQKDWSDYFAAAYGTGGFAEGMKLGMEAKTKKATLEQQDFTNQLALAKYLQDANKNKQDVMTEYAKMGMSPSSTLTGMVGRGGDLGKIMRGVGIDGQFKPQVGIPTTAGVMKTNPALMTNLKALKANSGITINPEYSTAIADAIESGDQPPEMKGLYRYGGAVRGELAKRGFDLTKASRDWLAVTKTINGLNSTQQVRMRQALESVDQSLPMLNQLNEGLQRSGLRDVNWVTVNAALRGVGPQRDLATRYIGQINLMKDELAQAFMGGGVPTDQAFKLTAEILQPLYGKTQMSAALKQLGYNIKIRKSAISSIAPLSTSGEVNNPKMTGQASSGKLSSGMGYKVSK